VHKRSGPCTSSSSWGPFRGVWARRNASRGTRAGCAALVSPPLISPAMTPRPNSGPLAARRFLLLPQESVGAHRQRPRVRRYRLLSVARLDRPKLERLRPGAGTSRRRAG